MRRREGGRARCSRRTGCRVRAGRPSDRSRSRRLRDNYRCLLGARTLPGVAPPAGAKRLLRLPDTPGPGTWTACAVPARPPTTQGDRSGKGLSLPEISVDAGDDTGSPAGSVNRRLTCEDAHRRRSRTPSNGRRTSRERPAKSLQSKRKLPVRRLLLAGSGNRRLSPRVRIQQPGGLRRPGGFRREVE
jgi:hypothetical protein